MPKYQSAGPSLPRRTLDYLQRGAAEGMRNAELFDATCQFRDAGSSFEDAESQLLARALADGLTESEARTTIRSAFTRTSRQPAANGHSHAPVQHLVQHQLQPPQSPAPSGGMRGTMPVPPPCDDGFVRLLEACFRPGEFVAIAPAAENEDGEIVPRSGTTLTAAEWKARVVAKGGIDRVFGTKHGLFVRINPMRQGGSRNEDVAAFRHVLVEFDCDRTGEPIPKDEQYHAVRASNMPVAALIDSGNKSLHAWIRVDAPDEAEYKRRVAIIWDWFAAINLDKQNRNPSRLSRCPDGWRTVAGERRRQCLLATGFGAESWDAWEAAHNAPGDDSLMPITRLAGYDTANDPNNVLGERWLCRGGSLVVVGQSGVGKSSLCMQLMILWALGLPAFNITPVRPLVSVLIQAENDIGDLAEMYQGVRQGMGLTAAQEAILDQRIFIYRDTTRTGEEFVKGAAALVGRHQPDLVWADPLLNYIGDDISEQRVISEFCCNLLNEVSLRTGVIWCLLHHTGKPSRDPKAGTHWTASDLAYSGLGSSALTNWSRETAALMRVKTAEGEPPTFQLSMTKRRKRAGLRSTAGEVTDTIFLRHSPHGGICWEQCEAPAVEPERKTSNYKIGRKSAFDPVAFRAVIDAHGGALTRSNDKQVAAASKCSIRTAWNWWKQLNNNDL
jgi:RecA-family ATPase